MLTKFVDSSVIPDQTLGARQIRVVANSGKTDRVKDVVVASGVKLDNYRKNPIVLADHNRTVVVGTFSPKVEGGALTGVVTFPPKGISARADEECGLYKSGVKRAVSIGFDAIKMEPNKDGGITFSAWELLELSLVSVPCDPSALVVERSAAKSGRKISAANSAKLRAAHRHAGAIQDIIGNMVNDAPDTELSRARGPSKGSIDAMQGRNPFSYLDRVQAEVFFAYIKSSLGPRQASMVRNDSARAERMFKAFELSRDSSEGTGRGNPFYVLDRAEAGYFWKYVQNKYGDREADMIRVDAARAWRLYEVFCL